MRDYARRDGAEFNATTHQMQLYELSQSSFYVAEAAHLIELAAIIGKPQLAAHLAARETAMRSLITDNLWDESRNVFANRYPEGGKNKGFGPKISPTSFCERRTPLPACCAPS